MKNVKGFFVIVVKQFDTTMPGADYHYTSWCIAQNEYCRFYHTEDLKLFDSYDDAASFAEDRLANLTHDVKFEIVYLTTTEWEDEAALDNLNHWIQVSNEQEAVDYDVLQKSGEAVDEFDPATDDISWYDTTQFHAIYS